MKQVKPKVRSNRRVLVTEDEDREDTPVASLKNLGPVTLPEIESLGIKTLGQMRELGWEEVCRRWVESYPERLNVNAFIGIIATLEGISWTKITPSQKAKARQLAKKLRTNEY